MRSYTISGRADPRAQSSDLYESPVTAASRSYTVNGLNQYTQVSGDGAAALSHDANSNLTSDGSTAYVYDAENRLVRASGELLRRYVHGPGVDEPLVWYEGTGVGAGSRRYLHADHQG